MKNKKGFTLIELLAIIIVLAAIALITAPAILRVIENAKKGAATDSAYGYKEAVNKFYTKQVGRNEDFDLDGVYIINNDGSITQEETTHEILVSGKKPTGGYLIIDEGDANNGCIEINDYAVTIEKGKAISTEKGTCNNPYLPQIVEEFPQVQDTNPGIICGDGLEEGYDSTGICYIYSVEDLVAFSNMVNSGKDFSGKTVKLMNNLDITNTKSYLDSTTQTFGDINGNETTTSLIDELTDTEGKGFIPIGNLSNKFAGTFVGNTKKIKNLYINRSIDNYVGLFGYNGGTIKGLKIESMTSTGNDYVGVLTGINAGSISSVIINGTLTGHNYVGIITGQNGYSGSSMCNGQIEAITSGTVQATNIFAGGIAGYQIGYSTINGVFMSGSITGSAAIGQIFGDKSSASASNGIASSTATVNGNAGASAYYTNGGGYTVPSNLINHVSTLDYVLDTYIGGENNDDGYYYDYDSNGNITIYSTEQNPLNITMQGEGTPASPYIINTKEELRQVAYDPTKSYKLNADINLSGELPIILSNVNHRFAGTFDGNLHTISNGTSIGSDIIGLFGYNGGTIKGLKLENMTSTGNNYVGALTGINGGSISSVIINGTVNGYNYVGIAAGQNGYSDSSVYNGQIEAITSGTVQATNNYAGGIAGYQIGYSTINGVFMSGSITGSAAIGQIFGDKLSSSASNGIASSTATVNGNAGASAYYTNGGGYTVPSNLINHVSTLDYVLDTYIGGENNDDGYYYDYDSNGNITIYSTEQNPLNITMQGEGTTASPYIITNYNELKQVALDQTKAYRLNVDIDLTNKNPIMLATKTRSFTGEFDGYAHTIRNGTIIGSDYTGLFGYNLGTIKGLKLENMTSTGNKYVGVLAGANGGSIENVLINGTLSGVSYVGLIAGQNGYSDSSVHNGQIKGVASGTVLATNIFAGGIAGYQIGYSTINGAFISGSITGSDAKGKIYGDKLSSSASNGISLSSATVNGNATSSTSYSNANGYTYSASDLLTSTPYEEIGLNFSDTNPNTNEYIWSFANNKITFTKN